MGYFVMDNMIKEIVATDKAARLELQRARERCEALSGELEEQTRIFEQKCSEEAKAKIEKAIAQLESGLEANKKRIAEETMKKREDLSRNFDQNHEEWEKGIFRRTVG